MAPVISHIEKKILPHLDKQDVRRSIAQLCYNYTLIGFLAALLTCWWTWPVSAWVALVLFVVFQARFAKIAPVSFLLLLPFSILRITEFISGIAIEHGAYLTEIVQTGAATGGFLRLAILYVIFCCVAAFVIESWVRQWKQAGIVKTFVENPHPISMTVVLAVNTCIGLCFAYLIYVGISKGFPLFTGADRFMFRLDIEDPVFNAIMVNRSVAVFYLGVMSAILRRGQLYNLLFIAVMVISALFGEKFTSIIILLAIFSMPMLLRRNWAFRQLHLKNVFVSLFIATCISLPLIFIAYKGLDNPGNAIKKFTERVALQGQLWYMADKGTHDLFHFDGAALSNDLRTIINPDYETYKYSHFPYVPYPYEGMRYLMIKYAPPDYVYQAFENHVAFAMGMHAYWLATTGWVGAFILNIVFAMFAGAILSILLFAIISTRPLLLLLAARLFIAWFGFQNLGDFYLIFNKNALITFVLFYILQAYDKKKYFKHQRI